MNSVEYNQLRQNQKYNKDDIVWAKLNKYPWWPGRIIKELPNCKKYEVIFFGDDSEADLSANMIEKFETGFGKYKNGKSKLLQTAISEALDYYKKQYGYQFKEADSKKKCNSLDTKKKRKIIDDDIEATPKKIRFEVHAYKGTRASKLAETQKSISPLNIKNKVKEVPQEINRNKQDKKQNKKKNNLMDYHDRKQIISEETTVEASNTDEIKFNNRKRYNIKPQINHQDLIQTCNLICSPYSILKKVKNSWLNIKNSPPREEELSLVEDNSLQINKPDLLESPIQIKKESKVASINKCDHQTEIVHNTQASIEHLGFLVKEEYNKPANEEETIPEADKKMVQEVFPEMVNLSESFVESQTPNILAESLLHSLKLVATSPLQDLSDTTKSVFKDVCLPNQNQEKLAKLFSDINTNLISTDPFNAQLMTYLKTIACLNFSKELIYSKMLDCTSEVIKLFLENLTEKAKKVEYSKPKINYKTHELISNLIKFVNPSNSSNQTFDTYFSDDLTKQMIYEGLTSLQENSIVDDSNFCKSTIKYEQSSSTKREEECPKMLNFYNQVTLACPETLESFLSLFEEEGIQIYDKTGSTDSLLYKNPNDFYSMILNSTDLEDKIVKKTNANNLIKYSSSMPLIQWMCENKPISLAFKNNEGTISNMANYLDFLIREKYLFYSEAKDTLANDSPYSSFVLKLKKKLAQ